MSSEKKSRNVMEASGKKIESICGKNCACKLILFSCSPTDLQNGVETFYARLERLLAQRKVITTFNVFCARIKKS